LWRCGRGAAGPPGPPRPGESARAVNSAMRASGKASMYWGSWRESSRWVGVAAASELRAAVDTDGIAGDPARIVGGKEGHQRGDVVRLGHALQRLHAKRD